MIHKSKIDETYSISSLHCWRPGCYESRRAANYAFRFKDEVLIDLQDKANRQDPVNGGTITFVDLQETAKEIKKIEKEK